MLNTIGKLIINLLSGYIKSLATKEFCHWAFFQIAGAIVDSTKTKEDNKWLLKIRQTVEK
jgi:hypothetical protein